MKISKVLNNNAVVVNDSGVEKIVMGSGVAFQKKKNDIVPKYKIEKIFVMKEEHEKFQELLKTLPEEHIALAEEIISYAEGELEVPLHDHIHIALTDHLSFAIERYQQNIHIQNKLLNEIKNLYKKEYKVGVWAIQLIKERLGIAFNEDEAGYIALHIHTAKVGTGNMQTTLNQTTMISEMIGIIERQLKLEINQNSIAYQRLLTHIRFALNRIEHDEPFHTMDQDMLLMIKHTYKQAFEVASELARFVEVEYDVQFPESEVGYMSLHIQRIAVKE